MGRPREGTKWANEVQVLSVWYQPTMNQPASCPVGLLIVMEHQGSTNRLMCHCATFSPCVLYNTVHGKQQTGRETDARIVRAGRLERAGVLPKRNEKGNHSVFLEGRVWMCTACD